MNYENYISLGHFCSVAMELERIGFRSTSSPFDWCITDFEGVVEAIKNHFEDFLSYDLLLQCDCAANRYYNQKYGIWFYHDFDEYDSLEKQLPVVQKKYERRIERFYKNIQKPTLFIRYITDAKPDSNGVPKELAFIEKNHDTILALLKSFHPENEILYIANEEVQSDVIRIYHVKKDAGDAVARKPLDQGALKELFDSFDYAPRQVNMAIYEKKQKRKNSFLRNLPKKLMLFLKARLCRKYVHERRISESDS